MASDMFESARCMVLASAPQDFSPEESREFLFKRTYPELSASFERLIFTESQDPEILKSRAKHQER